MPPSRHDLVNERLRESLGLYARHGYRPGDFLYAVLCNDFDQAVARADPTNVRLLREIREYVIEHVPAHARGSPAAVEAWLQLNAKRREAERAAAGDEPTE